MTADGIAKVVRRRGRPAGIDGLHPHQFRHTFAHTWLSEGGTEGDLMRVAGWHDRSMRSRYGAAAAGAPATPTAASLPAIGYDLFVDAANRQQQYGRLGEAP